MRRGSKPPGVGKTHLAIALAVQACQHGVSVYFTSLDQMIWALAAADRTGSSDSTGGTDCQQSDCIPSSVWEAEVWQGLARLGMLLPKFPQPKRDPAPVTDHLHADGAEPGVLAVWQELVSQEIQPADE